jgi:hypothetical protein
MLIQISDVIKSYETITRFDEIDKQNPRIVLGLMPFSYDAILDNLIKFHPEIKQKYSINSGYELIKKFGTFETYKTLMNYLQKSILDLKFDEMNKIIDTNSFITECQLIRDKHSFDFKNCYR